MQKDILKKKSYIRPEAEAVWMEEEGMIALSGVGEHEGWEGPERPSAKRNYVRNDDPWDDWEDDDDDDGWDY